MLFTRDSLGLMLFLSDEFVAGFSPTAALDQLIVVSSRLLSGRKSNASPLQISVGESFKLVITGFILSTITSFIRAQPASLCPFI